MRTTLGGRLAVEEELSNKPGPYSCITAFFKQYFNIIHKSVVCITHRHDTEPFAASY